MYKHNKYMALIAFVVVYVFILGILGEQGDYLGVKFTLSILMIIGVMYFSFSIANQFSVKTVMKGQKHREDLMNLVILLLFPVILSVLFYSTTGIREDNELYILILMSGFMLVAALLQYTSYYAVLEEDGIKANTLRKTPFISYKKASIKYSEITVVKFIQGFIWIRGANDTIYLKMSVTDMMGVLNTLTENVNEEIYKEAFEQLKEYFIKKRLQTNIEKINYYNNK